MHQALGSIYWYEAENTPQENETHEQYHTRILNNHLNNVKPLMDHINSIMMYLAEKVAELKGGKYIAKKKNSYSAAVVYYMNQKEALRYFLTDPRVPCDTNIVERTIRPLTIQRKNSHFAQSIEGVQSLCDIFTVFETAKVNGIDDPCEWLRRFGVALFKHCYEKGWTRALYDGKDPSKKIMQWDFTELAQDFDFSVWLPWHYKKR